MKHKAEEEARDAGNQLITPPNEIRQRDQIMITPSRDECYRFAEILGEYFVGSGKVSPYWFDCDWFQNGLRFALREMNVSVPENFLPKRKCIMRMVIDRANQHRGQTRNDIAMALIRNPNTR